MAILISVLSFLLILTIALTLTSREKTKSPVERLQDLGLYEEVDYKKETEEGPIKKLSRLVPKYDKTFSKLQRNIVYSDSKYSLEEIITVKVMSSGAFALLTYALSKNVIATMLVLISVWFIPNFYIANKAKKRMVAFNAQLADGMLVICNALKAGYSFMQATALVSKEMDGPLAKEFSTLLKEMSFGITIEESFANITQRVDSEDLKLVVNAILIQKDVGGNLAEILDKIIETIRERQRIKAEVKTLTAQGRLSGVIISVLPFGMALFLYFINRDYLTVLFQSRLGISLVIYGLISQTIGYFVIRKITDIEL
jgi:tight adherence protein B